MKKLAVIAGILVCVLAAALAVLVARGNTGEAGFFDVLKSGGSTAAVNSAPEEIEAHYDGELLCTHGFEQITYTDRDFKVEFANPFYAETPDAGVNVVFYDEKHGFMMRSIGVGTNSEFFECYRTEDGTETWNRCAQDLWFEVDAENIVEMTGPSSLIYIKTSPDLILGGHVTEITFSSDGGDSWNNYVDENIDETRLEIRRMIEELTLEERISQILVPAIEELADEDEPDMTVSDMVEEAMPGGVLWCDASGMSEWSFEKQMRQAQEFMMDEQGLPLVIVSTYAARPGAETEETAASETGEDENDEPLVIEAPQPDTYYATMAYSPSTTIEAWTSGLTVYPDDQAVSYFGFFNSDEAPDQAVRAVLAETPEMAVNALKQGTQLLIVPEGFEDVRDAVFEAVEAKNLTEIQINRALYQVLYAKMMSLQNDEEQ